MNLGEGETSETFEIANLAAELKTNGSSAFLAVTNPLASFTISAQDIDKPKMIALAKSAGVQKLAEALDIEVEE